MNKEEVVGKLAVALFKRDWTLPWNEVSQERRQAYLNYAKGEYELLESIGLGVPGEIAIPDEYWDWCQDMRNGKIDAKMLWNYINPQRFIPLSELKDN